jgi:hypothetical protein
MDFLRITLVLLVFTCAPSFAEETNTPPTKITIDGVTYEDVRWDTVTPATVSIFHKTGIASIPLEKLPPELQQQFGYDPKKANEYRTVEAARSAAAAKQAGARAEEEKRRRAREKEQAELEAQKDAEMRRKATEQGPIAPAQPVYSSADILGAKPYSIFELYKVYKKIKPGTVIIVRFSQVTSIESYSENAYWVHLRDDTSYDRLPAIVDEEGLSYFAPGKNQLRRDGSVYCTLEEKDLMNKMGGYFTGPVIHAIGATTHRALGGGVEITW